ncbi:MAG: MoaD/ThiS family protein [Chitinophagaceae bacterium]|nr:MoaD/ThiS family protein [Chitinophagaceae bacterium]
MITVLFFGKLAEVAESSVEVQKVSSTDELLAQLHAQYPLLASEKFVMAVNKKMISSNTTLSDNSTVALLPPFSGG